MKLLSMVCVVGILSAQTKQFVSELNWFAGQWEMVKGETVTEEHWLSESGNVMMGMSRTVLGNKLLEYEFIILEQDSIGNIYYRAKPVQQKDASFKLTAVEHRKAIFENHQHDFPQRIIYRCISEDSLVARIEGVRNGNMRSIEFSYRKKQ